MRKAGSDRPLPLTGLRGFEAAARHLSFKKAAAELHLTQSAVSRQIQSLEQALGMPLFERRTRALALTEAGTRLLSSVQPLLAGVDGAVRSLRGRRERGHVTLTTFASFVSMWLLARLPEFNAASPELDVRLVAVDRVVDLASEDVDLAVRYCAPRRAPRGARLLFRERVFPVCSPALLARRGVRLTRLEDLASVPLLDFDPAGQGMPWLTWRGWLDAQGRADLEVSPALSFTYADQILLAAARGQGVALGRTPIVADMLASGDLVAPFGRRVVGGQPYFLVSAPRAEKREEVRRFVDWLENRARETESWLAAHPVLATRRSPRKAL